MTEGAAIGALAAFAAGIVSFLSPCVLPLVPAYVSYVAGESYHRRRRLHAEERLAGLQIGGGLVLVALGVAVVTGQLPAFSIWMLDAVPALGRLG
jgi:cytochrome c-type biogenesis protein